MATKPKTTKTAKAEVAASAVQAPTLRFVFTTEEKSPFPDGYSIKGEEAALAEFMAGDMNESDPLYDRYIELEDRKDRLEREQHAFNERNGANAIVTRQEARGLNDLGVLVDEEVDQMTIHTKEA